MNIAVVDDIPMEVKRLKMILKKYASVNGLEFELDCFSSAEELLSSYHRFKYTLIFMDIYMNGMTGVTAAEKIRSIDNDVLLIFLTSSTEHMPDAFRCHAYDYIQKPADPKRLFHVMDDILKRHTIDTDKLAFSSNRTEYALAYADIVTVRTADHYLEITDNKGTTYKTRMTFSAASNLLTKDKRFLLILRGVLVNMDYIIHFSDNTCHMKGDIHLPINVRNSKKIEQIWQNYLFSKDHNK